MMNTTQGQSNAVAGDWVQVHNTVLTPEQRTGHIPEDTRHVPFESWVKGFMTTPTANLGDLVELRTTCGRHVSGELIAILPGYDHGFGDAAIPELLAVGPQARAILQEGRHA